jgi:protein FRG1
MVTKLKFKGEKHKKRKRTDADADAQASRDAAEDNEGWVNAQSLDDVSSGPLFIVFASSSPIAITYGTSGSVSASVIKSVGEDGSADNAEPDSVPQVWIATRLAQSDKISIKTHDSKFLSCDKVGLLSASKEAIGAQEEWRPIQTSDGWALQNVYDKFLYVTTPDKLT